MGTSKREKASLLCLMVTVLVLQSLSIPAYGGRNIQEELNEQKNNYGPTTPHSSSPPKHSSSKSPACPTPSHGSGGGGSHSTPTTPSHGSRSGYHNAPPIHGGSGGGSSPPNYGGGVSPPNYGGGGSPPNYGGGGSPPNYGGGGSPPDTTPTTPVPSPPVAYDPNVPPYHPGTCSYWIAHPDKVVAVIGYVASIGDFFGAACVFAYGGKNPSLHDAVANTNKDGISSLLREGTAALLNSMACNSFPLSQQQVRSAFAGSLGNDGAAAAQAGVFKMANEGLYKS